jgi:hypothetical protein
VGIATEIGQLFELSAVKVGARLKSIGVRKDDGKPTEDALKSGLAVATPMKGGFDHYMWNKQLITEKLRQDGLKQIAGSSDKAFLAVQAALKMIRQGEKLDAQGEDRMARFSYQAAQLEIADTLGRENEKSKVQFAVRIFDQFKRNK